MPCDPPIPYTGARSNAPSSLLSGKALMGWNQLVFLETAGAPNLFGSLPNVPLRVENYNIGVRQQGEAPDYVTGRQGHTAWTKGPIETDGDLAYPFTFTSGLGMFTAASELVKFPNESFTIQSSVHPKISGCKVNTATIEVNAGEMIRSNATVWGIVETLDNDFAAPIFEAGGLTNLQSVSSADGDRACRTVGLEFGVPDGVSTIGLELNLEQIPQWDVVHVDGAPCNMQVVGVTLNIDNRLQRNYTMGDCDGASKFGLNANSITGLQRRVTGTVRWQSDADSGTIAQILAVGLTPLTITIARPTGGPIIFHMEHALWNAEPPVLSPGDRVIVESSFEALASNDTEFDELIVTA